MKKVFISLLILVFSMSFALHPVSAEVPAEGPQLENAEITLEKDEEATTKGIVIYNVTVAGKIPEGQIPRQFPIELNAYKDGREVSEQIIRMNPTRSIGIFRDNRRIATTAKVQYILTKEKAGKRNFTIIANDILSGTAQSETRKIDVNALSDIGLQSQSSRITIEETSETESSTTSVSRYIASESASKTLESNSIPLNSPRGNVSDFYNVRSSNTSTSAVFSSAYNGMNIGTKTDNLPEKPPYTIVIGYLPTSGDDIDIDVIGLSGNTVDRSTDYTLPSDPTTDNRCNEGTNYNLCVFTISDTESKFVEQADELLLRYNSGTGTEARIFCQLTVSGYITRGESICGTKTADDYSDVSLKKVEKRIEGNTDWKESLSPDTNTNLEYRMTIKRTGSSSQTDVYWDVYDESNINPNRTIIEGSSPIDSGETTINGGETVTQRFSERTPEQRTLESYTVFLCRQDDCDRSNAFQIETVETPISTGISLPPQVVAKEPLRPTLPTTIKDNKFKGSITKTLANEPKYPSGDWEEIRTISDTSGFQQETVELTVTDSNLEEDDGTLKSKYINELKDNLSIAPGGNSWNIISHDIETKSIKVDYGEANKYTNNNKWTRSDEVVDTKNTGNYQTFQRASVNATRIKKQLSKTGIFLDRSDQSGVSSIQNPATKVRTQAVDPDRCLNCWRAEKLSQRKSKPAGAIKTGADIWSQPIGAGVVENAQIETSANYQYRDSSLGQSSMVFENPGVATADLYRIQSFRPSAPIKVKQWTAGSRKDRIRYESVNKKDVYKWTKARYKIKATFKAKLPTGVDIKVWEKGVKSAQKEYEPETVFFDLSQSYDAVSESSGSFEYVEIIPDGAKLPFRFKWRNDVHSTSEEDRSCDGTIKTYRYTKDVISGTGGPLVVEKCLIDSNSDGQPEESYVLRVGKEYSTPKEAEVTVRITDSSGQSGKDNMLVNVVSELDKGNDDSSDIVRPDFSVNAINEKVNYESGYPTFELNINSNAENLGTRWQLRVTPAGRMGSAASCPSGYSTVSSETVEQETKQSETVTLSKTCERVGVASSAPDRFNLVEVSSLASIGSDDDRTGVATYDIPSDAIDECSGYLRSNTDSTCINTVNSKTVSLNDNVPSSKFKQDRNAYVCPPNYRKTTQSSIKSAPQIQSSLTIESSSLHEVSDIDCISNSADSFTLQTRERRYLYTSVRNDVYDSCPQNYTQSEQNGDIVCEKKNGNGPVKFTLKKQNVNILGENTMESFSIPPGAVRQCKAGYDSKVRSEQLVCINDGGESYSIARITESTPVREKSSKTFSNPDVTKSIWTDSIVPGKTEEVIAKINPRSNGAIRPTGDSKTQEFTFTLETVDDSDVGQTKRITKNIHLCKAESTSSAPKVAKSSYGCDNFDSDLDGVPDIYGTYSWPNNPADDWTSGGQLLSESVNKPNSIGSTLNNEQLSQIQQGEKIVDKTLKNDACPQSRKYPISTDIDTNIGVDDTSQTSEQISQYYVTEGSSICESTETAYEVTEMPESEESLTIDWKIWNEYEKSKSMIRHTGVRNINTEGDVSQDSYVPSESLSVGYTLDQSKNINDGLVAYYPFDSTQRDSSEFATSNTLKIQDIYSDNDVGNLNGRIWMANTCSKGVIGDTQRECENNENIGDTAFEKTQSIQDTYQPNGVLGSNSLKLSKNSYALFSDVSNNNGEIQSVNNGNTIEDEIGSSYTISFWYKPPRLQTTDNSLSYQYPSHTILGATTESNTQIDIQNVLTSSSGELYSDNCRYTDDSISVLSDVAYSYAWTQQSKNSKDTCQNPTTLENADNSGFYLSSSIPIQQQKNPKWDNVVIRKNQNKVEIYVNGIKQDGISATQLESGVGDIISDSILTLGGKLEEQQNGEYKLTDTTRGNIDELRVYDSYVSESVIDTLSLKNYMSTQSSVEGSIKTEKIPVSEIGDKSKLSGRASVSLDGYGEGRVKITLTPCKSGQCYERDTVGFTNWQTYSDTVEKTSYPISTRRPAVVDFNRDSITHLKASIEIAQTELTENAYLSEIQIQDLDDSSGSCDSILEEYPGLLTNDGAYKTSSGIVRCDMSNAGGGWTRFSWYEEGATVTEDPFTTTKSISSCDYMAKSCSATPPVQDTEQNLSILVRSVNNNNETSAISVLNLNKYMNWRNQRNTFGANAEYDTCTNANPCWNIVAEQMKDTFTRGPDSTQNSQSSVSQSVSMCIYPVHTSEGYQPQGNCYDTFTSSSNELTLGNNQDNIRIKTNNGKVQDIRCLNNDGHRCEFYYRTGELSSLNNTVPNNQDDADPNQPPVIESVDNPNKIIEGQQETLSVQATDPDGDDSKLQYSYQPLSSSVSVSSSGATGGSGNAQLTGLSVGTSTIRVKVTDEDDGVTYVRPEVTVVLPEAGGGGSPPPGDSPESGGDPPGDWEPYPQPRTSDGYKHCGDVLASGKTENKTYTIDPDEDGDDFDVRCLLSPDNKKAFTLYDPGSAKRAVQDLSTSTVSNDGLKAKSGADVAFDGSNPYFFDNDGGGARYDIPLGYDYTIFTIGTPDGNNDMVFGSVSHKRDGSDTSEIGNDGHMNKWSNTNGGFPEGDIGFGSPLADGPAVSWFDKGGGTGFGNSGTKTYPGNSIQVVMESQSSDVFRIQMTEHGGQEEGFKWKSGVFSIVHNVEYATAGWGLFDYLDEFRFASGADAVQSGNDPEGIERKHELDLTKLNDHEMYETENGFLQEGRGIEERDAHPSQKRFKEKDIGEDAITNVAYHSKNNFDDVYVRTNVTLADSHDIGMYKAALSQSRHDMTYEESLPDIQPRPGSNYKIFDGNIIRIDGHFPVASIEASDIDVISGVGSHYISSQPEASDREMKELEKHLDEWTNAFVHGGQRLINWNVRLQLRSNTTGRLLDETNMTITALPVEENCGQMARTMNNAYSTKMVKVGPQANSLFTSGQIGVNFQESSSNSGSFGDALTGAYRIDPDNDGDSFNVHCVFDDNGGGGEITDAYTGYNPRAAQLSNYDLGNRNVYARGDKSEPAETVPSSIMLDHGGFFVNNLFPQHTIYTEGGINYDLTNDYLSYADVSGNVNLEEPARGTGQQIGYELGDMRQTTITGITDRNRLRPVFASTENAALRKDYDLGYQYDTYTIGHPPVNLTLDEKGTDEASVNIDIDSRTISSNQKVAFALAYPGKMQFRSQAWRLDDKLNREKFGTATSIINGDELLYPNRVPILDSEDDRSINVFRRGDKKQPAELGENQGRPAGFMFPRADMCGQDYDASVDTHPPKSDYEQDNYKVDVHTKGLHGFLVPNIHRDADGSGGDPWFNESTIDTWSDKRATFEKDTHEAVTGHTVTFCRANGGILLGSPTEKKPVNTRTADTVDIPSPDNRSERVRAGTGSDLSTIQKEAYNDDIRPLTKIGLRNGERQINTKSSTFRLQMVSGSVYNAGGMSWHKGAFYVKHDLTQDDSSSGGGDSSPTKPTITEYASCQGAKSQLGSLPNGTYSIDPDDDGDLVTVKCKSTDKNTWTGYNSKSLDQMIEDGAGSMDEHKYGSAGYSLANSRSSARLNLEGPNPLNKSHELGVFDSCPTRRTTTRYGSELHNKVCGPGGYAAQAVNVSLSLGYSPEQMRLDGIGNKSDAFGIRHQRNDIKRTFENSRENQSIFDDYYPYDPLGTQPARYSGEFPGYIAPRETSKEVIFGTPTYGNARGTTATFDMFGRDAVTLENIGHNQKDIPVYYNNWENIVGERTSMRFINNYFNGPNLYHHGSVDEMSEYKPSVANSILQDGKLRHPEYDSYSWTWTAQTEDRWGNPDKNKVTQDMCKKYEAKPATYSYVDQDEVETYPGSIVCQVSPDSATNPKEQIIDSSKVSRERLVRDVDYTKEYMNRLRDENKYRNHENLDGPDIADEFNIVLLNARDHEGDGDDIYEAEDDIYQRSYLTWHSGYIWLSPKEYQPVQDPTQ